jgi:hypothetical protein
MMRNRTTWRRVRRLVKRELWRPVLKSIIRSGIASEHALAVWLHLERTGKLPNLVRPRTFNDKLLVKALRDRREYLVETADKFAAREYVRRVVGGEVLIDLIHVGETLDDFDLESLTEPYVVKANHGAGKKWIRLVPNPASADIEEIRAAARGWAAHRHPPTYEWWYREIPKKVLVEAFLGEPAHGPPNDVKFWVATGRIVLIQVDADRFGSQTRDLYTPDWERLDVRRGRYPRSDAPIPQPENLGRMIELAKRLGSGTDFVRVDLYDCDGEVKFGEMTHCPAGGIGQFSDPALDRFLASTWDPPRRRKTS